MILGSRAKEKISENCEYIHKQLRKSNTFFYKILYRDRVKTNDPLKNEGAAMNRSKRAMNNKLRKKMSKEIRLAQASYPTPESRSYSDELTTKEMLKKYPKKVAKKHAEAINASKKRIGLKKKAPRKGLSKRTTPGTVPSDSSPAYPHREGKRWIKNLNKQTLNQRAIASRKGNRKK
jgi:hypothetical protein